MKKTLLLTALLVGLLLFAGTFADKILDRTVGSHAPSLSLAEADSIVVRDRMQGDYVLLNFWASTDAPSRRAANTYTAWQRRNPDAPLQLVGINFDESADLFNEIVRRDSLNAADQFHAEGPEAQKISTDYNLTDGLGSVLVAPDGKIIALNPTDADLNAIVR